MNLIGCLLLLTTYVAGSPLVGSKKCTWGPTYWCSHIDHAKKCGAVQHCLQTVWQNQRIQVKSDETCTYCMLLVGELRSALENKATEDEIAKGIADACALLPPGIDRNICKGIVKDDIPIVMQILLSKITPSMACNAVGFCSVPDEEKPTTETTTVTKTTKTTALTTTTGVQTPCEDCMKFIKDLQNAITSNETVSQLEQIIHDMVCQNLGPFAQECDNLVAQGLPLALAFLADQCDPDKFCRLIGFCVSDQELPFKIPLKNVFANRAPIPLKYKSSEECEICKDLLTQIVDIIRDKTYQDKAKYMIENDFCSRLGSFSDQCKQLVDEYFPQLVELLVNELDPTTVCEAVGLCQVPGGKLSIQPVLKMLQAKPVSNGVECDVCEMIAKELDSLLEQNETVKTLEDLVDKICKRLPDETLTEKCEDFVKQYEKEFIKFLLTEMAPKKICTELGLCTKNSKEMSKTHAETKDYMLNDDAKCELCKFMIQAVQNTVRNMTTADIIADLETLCKYVPDANLSAMCSQYLKEYGTFVIDLLKTSPPEVICGLVKACGTGKTNVPLYMVPIPEVPKKTEKETISKECEICDTVLMILKELVTQNMTEAEIKQMLETVCDKIPYISSECHLFVEKYEKEIIDYLMKKLDPYTICKKIHLCESSQLQSVQPLLTGILTPLDTLPLQVAHTEPKKPVEGDTSCVLCKTVLNSLDDILEQNSSEEAIRKALDSVCKDLPKAVTTDCVYFVDKYTAVVVDYIVLNLDADVICKIIKLCPAQTEGVRLVHVPLMKDTKGMSRKLETEAAGPYCVICEFVMKELDRIIGENKTEEAIKAALEKVCSILPKDISKECDAFVEEYGDLVLKLLEQKLDPEQICTELGLCSQTYMQTLVAAVHLIPSKSSAESAMSKKLESKASLKCVMCEYVMEYLDKLIGDNKTEANILKALDDVCNLLPKTVSTECKDFVKDYGKEILNLLLQSIDPQQICTAIGLCSQNHLQGLSAVVHLIQTKVSDKSVKVGTVQCDLCEEAANYLKAFLDANTTQEEVEDFLDKLCNFLPDTVTAQCHAVVQQYVPAILDLLKEDINATQLCQIFGLCSSKGNLVLKPGKTNSLPMSKIDDALYFKPHGSILGQDECTYGPSFWCKDEETAKRCNAWEHCQRHVWNRN